MNYIQQAYKGKNDLWIFILTTLVVAGFFILNLVLFLLLGDEIDFAQTQEDMMALVPSKNFWLAFNLLIFAPFLALLFVFVRYVHQRSLLSLTTTRKRIDFKRVFFAFGLVAVFTIVPFAISYYLDPSQVVWQFDPVKFGILVVISLLLFPIQIGMEEYLFRGYLMQQIGIMARNRWVPLLITSVAFGVFHGANPEVGAMGPIVMIFYIGTGLLLGIMTLMDEGLELALGFHFGNNFLAATLVTADWSALQTDALFVSTAEVGVNPLMEVIVPVLVIYPILLFVLAKKYKWTHWKEKLFGKVAPPETEVVTH
ncbi:MAG: CPBP family intramembrane glutamic endopeptidase [Bacteroidota bacterium]